MPYFTDIYTATRSPVQQIGMITSGSYGPMAMIPDVAFLVGDIAEVQARYDLRVTSSTLQLQGEPAGDLERVFMALADEWRRETQYLSSDHRIAMHSAYQRIIGMGERAIPLILSDLQRHPEPGHWFWALRMITNENPVPPEHAGDMRHMRDHWINWGRRRGYIGSRVRVAWPSAGEPLAWVRAGASPPAGTWKIATLLEPNASWS